MKTFQEKGLFAGRSHSNGGTPLIVKPNNFPIEVERDEYLICKGALESKKIYQFRGTIKRILDKIFNISQCKVKDGQAIVDDFVICKRAVLDPEPIVLTGTIQEVLNQLQAEHGCKTSYFKNKDLTYTEFRTVSDQAASDSREAATKVRKIISQNDKMLYGGKIGIDQYTTISDDTYNWNIQASEIYFLYRKKAGIKLGKLITHNNLFSLYPEIESIKVYFSNGTENSGQIEGLGLITQKEFKECKITITLNFDYYEKHNREFRTIDSDEPDLSRESILLHEIQHVLQALHNRPSGTTKVDSLRSGTTRIGAIKNKRISGQSLTKDEERFYNAYKILKPYELQDYLYYSDEGEKQARKSVILWLKSKGFIYIDPLAILFGLHMKSGGKIKTPFRPEEISEEDLHRRWSKKRERIQNLANNIISLRRQVNQELKSDDQKIFLTALAIYMMDKTAERVGNDASAAEGHVGITGLKKSHIQIDGNKVTLEYTGKSGVQHIKTLTDDKLAKYLNRAIRRSSNKYVFTAKDGFEIKADRINRYLTDFNITAKDIRGYSANKWITDKLKKQDIPQKETERKKLFKSILKTVAKKIGHGPATLRKHYMMPELMTEYIESSNIIDLKEAQTYETGGQIESSCGCPHKKEDGGPLEKPKLVSIDKLITYEKKLGQTVQDIQQGKVSKSKDEPSTVTYVLGKKQFHIKDGHHRILEQVMEGEEKVLVIEKPNAKATHNITTGPIIKVSDFEIPEMKLGGLINSKFDLGKNHHPFIKVAKGGSCCANCKFITKEGKEYHCTNQLFVKWNGTSKLPDNINEICSDWYLPKDKK